MRNQQNRKAIVQRITVYGHIHDEQQLGMLLSMVQGPTSYWVATTDGGQKVLAKGQEKTDVLQSVQEQGYKVEKVLNDWN